MKEYMYIVYNILRKNLTNTLICVNTALFTLLDCYMLQPSMGHPQGVLIRFVRQGKKI